MVPPGYDPAAPWQARRPAKRQRAGPSAAPGKLTRAGVKALRTVQQWVRSCHTPHASVNTDIVPMVRSAYESRSFEALGRVDPRTFRT